MALPTFIIECDFPRSGTWTDITSYVSSCVISRGRSREVDEIQPGQMSLALDNKDGRFTPGLSSGAYYPNIKPYRSLRVSISTGTRSFLFTGAADSWQQGWDGDRYGSASVSATDGFKALSRAVSRGIYQDTAINTGPTAYYPLSEPANATMFANAQPNTPQPFAQLLTSKYGSGTFVAGDAQGFLKGQPQATACTFTHTGSGNSEGMTVVQFAGGQIKGGPSIPASGPWSVSFWFKAPTTPTNNPFLFYARSAPVADASTGAGFHSVRVQMDNAGHLIFAVLSAYGPIASATSGATSYADGQWHKVTGTFGADSQTATMYVDSNTSTGVASVAFNQPGLSWIVAGGALSQWGESAQSFTGSLASIEFYPTALSSLSHNILWLYGRDGFFVSRDSGSFITNVAQNNGYSQLAAPYVVADSGVTSTMAVLDTAGMSALQVLQAYAGTEQGVMFIQGDGTLRSLNRAARVNQASAFTLNASAYGVTASTVFGIDDTLIVNDYAATRPGGGISRVQDQLSKFEYGRLSNAENGQATSILVTTDNEVNDYASFKVANYGQPKPRTPSITVDLLANQSLWSVVQGVDIGTRFTVSNLPSPAPTANIDLVVESVRWSFSWGDRPSFMLQLETSPADTTPYMTFDDSAYGLFDTDAFFY